MTIALSFFVFYSAACDAGKGQTKESKRGPFSAVTEITLQWQVPNARLDGTSLDTSDLTHYVVTYRDAAGTLDEEVIVNFGDTTQFTIGELPAGEYTFTVVAVDVHGATSPAATLQHTL